MAKPRRRWNIAEISGDELEPVDRVLLLTQSLNNIAKQRIVATEIEFNNLAWCHWDPASEDAKRFYFLRWEREGLRKFIKMLVFISFSSFSSFFSTLSAGARAVLSTP